VPPAFVPAPLPDAPLPDAPLPDAPPADALLPGAPLAVGSAAVPVRTGRHAKRADQDFNGHPLDGKTVLLPAFVTGRKDEPPSETPAPPAGPQAGDKLPATERGMLVFVAALLALGTVAVVAMLGFGGLTTRHPPVGTRASSPTPEAGALAAPSPSPSPSASPSPSPSPSPSRKPVPPSRKPSSSPSPSAVPLGGVNLNSFCSDVSRGSSPAPPSKDRSTWACVNSFGTVKRTFTPDQVCIYQYPLATHAVVGTLSNPGTWKCFR
jgi:hypothetical protein